MINTRISAGVLGFDSHALPPYHFRNVLFLGKLNYIVVLTKVPCIKESPRGEKLIIKAVSPEVVSLEAYTKTCEILLIRKLAKVLQTSE